MNREKENLWNGQIGYCLNMNLIDQLISKLLAVNKSSNLVITYVLTKVIKLQAYYRMKIARRLYLLKRRTGRVLLSSGPARLTYSARQKGGQLESTRQVTWLVLSPPTVFFKILSFEKKDRRSWSTSVAVSELVGLRTQCREVLARRASIEARLLLQCLSRRI